MAMKKTKITVIESKPKLPYKEYPLVAHPRAEDALAIFEDIHGYRPQKMYHYIPPSGKFQSWIIVEDES